jgi:hypothetical protein
MEPVTSHLTMEGMDLENIHDELTDELGISVEDLQEKLETLCDTNFLKRILIEDRVYYISRDGLSWPEIRNIADPIKQRILREFIQNPKTQFVLYNTQKGKARIIAMRVKEMADNKSHKLVVFGFLDNDKTLGDQSLEAFTSMIGLDKIEPFILSSNHKITIKDIIRHIDAYLYLDDYKMPFIIGLANDSQLQKILTIIQHIHMRNTTKGTNLEYAVFWDEADKIYPQLRDKVKMINGIPMSIKSHLVDSMEYLHESLFVTATEGELLSEDYPECQNALFIQQELEEEDKPYYRVFHHTESIYKYEKCPNTKSNNDIIKRILTENKTYIQSPITLSSGEIYQRKYILNANPSNDDMKDLAKFINREIHGHAALFNQHGITLYQHGNSLQTKPKIQTKGRKFNELLFWMYKRYKLSDKPLFILGRRKVDRGLAFHYAPRSHRGRLGPTEIEYKGEVVHTDGKEGLIWTDMFLGRIDDKDTAVQKAGRGAGIIAQCPQYCDSFTYWVHKDTAVIIDHQNRVVDTANTNIGSRTLLQAVENAKSVTKKKNIRHTTNPEDFRVYQDRETLNKVCSRLGYRIGAFTRDAEKREFYKTSLNSDQDIYSLLDVIKKVPGAYTTAPNGQRNYRTCLPCYEDINNPETLRFVVVIKPGTNKDLLKELDELYPPIDVPQEE